MIEKRKKQIKRQYILLLRVDGHTKCWIYYIVVQTVWSSARRALEVQCLRHHLPPVHQLLALLLLPLHQRLQLKVHLRRWKQRIRHNKLKQSSSFTYSKLEMSYRRLECFRFCNKFIDKLKTPTSELKINKAYYAP